MRVLILQLSDIHCTDNSHKFQTKLNKAIESVGTIQDIDSVILVFSGDLVNTSSKNEFRAAKQLLGKFLSDLGKVYNCFIPLILVPGNHDMDLPKDCRTSAEILEWDKDERLDEECARLKYFFEYAHRKSCFNKSLLYDNKTITVGEIKIQFSLLNSAPFSTRKQDNKELHYFPTFIGERIGRSPDADIKISVMHHSYEWCDWDTKQMLKKAFTNDDVTFFGHDHSAEMLSLTTTAGSGLNIIMGGEFTLDTDAECAFNAIVYDHDAQIIERYEFNWNLDAQMFIKTAHPNIVTRRNAAKLEPTEQYLDMLLEDKHQLSKRFTDYYVLPKLLPEGAAFSDLPTEKITLEVIFRFVEDQGILGITSDNGYGRSSLLKYLYKESICLDYLPLWIEKRTYDSNFEKMFRGLFEDQYGNAPYGYERYIQQSGKKRILFVDDFDLIKNKKVRDNLIKYAANNGYLVIYTAQTFIQEDLTEAVKDKLAEKEINHLKVLPFYKEKRDELVSSICVLEQYSNFDKNTIIAALDYLVQCQASLFTLAPDNLTQYIKYLLNGGKQGDKGIRTISLVIETNIRNSIIANAKQGDAQVYLAALEFVAHHMYFNLRSEYISISELEATIANFNTKRKAKVTAKTFYTTCMDAKIFAEQGDSFDISFSSKNTLAYFVAKYVARELERNPSNLDDINYIMSHICFGINDIIILFLSFITSNVSIIIKIAITAYNLLNKYPELDFDTNNMPFLKNGKAVPASLPSPQEKAQHNKNTEAIEKVRHDAVSFRGIFDFDEGDVEKEKYKVVRAFKYTQVIARTLVDQFGNLEADELDTMTNALYSLPQRVLFALLAPYQNHYEKIVAELKRFADEKLPELKLSEKKIKEQFAEAAVLLALNVMNDIAFNASDPNTVDVLKEYQVSNTNHQIQKLMMVENAGDTNAFVDAALSLYKQRADDPFSKYLIWHIARKHIIHTEDIDKRQVDRLVSGGVFEVKGKRRLLLEQGKQEKG